MNWVLIAIVGGILLLVPMAGCILLLFGVWAEVRRLCTGVEALAHRLAVPTDQPQPLGRGKHENGSTS